MTTEQQNENGLRAVEVVRAFLDKMEMNPVEKEINDGLAFMIDLEDAPTNQAVVQVHIEAERMVLHFIFDGYVEPERRVTVAEFITRANWGLIEGNFELNFTNGALRYKVGLDFTGNELTELWMRNCMLDGMNTIELFAEALEKVVSSQLKPDEAYEEAKLNFP
ncbi:MAG TPA: hypothetical protein VGJ37_11285 [Pyrinomonadaceae bacterium]|jgi:hypothetical protein